ncbi:Chromo domain-containing protein, partial [Cephalotus follicularis]
VFHISLLKPYHGPAPDTTISPLPPTNFQNKPVISPMAIVDTRTIFSKGQPSPQILVQWFGLPLEEATWENVIDIQQAYHDLNLEDKVGLQGGRNDTGLVKQ